MPHGGRSRDGWDGRASARLVAANGCESGGTKRRRGPFARSREAGRGTYRRLYQYSQREVCGSLEGRDAHHLGVDGGAVP